MCRIYYSVSLSFLLTTSRFLCELGVLVVFKACIDFHHIDFTRRYGSSGAGGEKLLLVEVFAAGSVVFVYKHLEQETVLLRFLNLCSDCVFWLRNVSHFDALPINLTHSDMLVQVKEGSSENPLQKTPPTQSVSISGWPSSHAIMPHSLFYQTIDKLDLSTSEPI